MGDTSMEAGQLSVESALKDVFKSAMAQDGLARGLHQCCKALEKNDALLCVLADNCDEPNYKKVVEALCAERNINLIKLDDNKQLGELAGLCKIDRQGNARKIVSCSVVVVRSIGETGASWQFLQDHIRAAA